MKFFTGIAIFLLVLGALFAYNEAQQTKLQAQQVANYENQISQLLSQIETNSLQRIEAEKQLQSLRKQLNSNDSQIAALSRQLELAQQQINPEYEQLEARIRQQLSRELQPQSNGANTDPRVSLFKQLSALDPAQMSEIFALHGQFGGFLQSLNVSDERLEVIIGALSNMIAEQGQARMQLIQEMQSNPQLTNRRDIRQQMMAIASPEAQLEALAFDLSESELEALAEFQQQRQNTSVSLGSFGSTNSGAVFLGTDVIQGGSGRARAIQLPATPDN